MKGCFATLLLCYFLPMHVFRYNEAVAQILSDFYNGPYFNWRHSHDHGSRKQGCPLVELPIDLVVETP